MTELRNPVQMLLHWAEQKPNQAYLHQPVGADTKVWTWAQTAAEVRRVAGGLKALSLPPGSRIAISGMNTAHWFMADMAIAMAGHIAVGLYPKQAPEAVRFILEHADAKAIFIGPMPDAELFRGAIPPGVLTLSTPYPEVGACDRHWEELVKAAPLESYTPPPKDSIWSLIYTSGTTGNPKGVIMSGENVEFVVNGLLRAMPPQPGGDIFLSYLPLAHAFERGAVEMASLYLCAQVHFLAQIEKLGETLAQVRPTRFFGVPLVFSRVQGAILKKMPAAKLNRLLSIPILNTIIRRRIKQKMGLDRAALTFSGAAPLPLPLINWFERLGVTIYQGYGMTENSIYLSVNLPGANRPGSVGRPFSDAPTRLSSEKEIQCKHPGVTPGYYRDPEKTRELFTEDGWLRTGDVGRLDEDGFLFITGRVKEIFKTLKGKYVAPAPIEGSFAQNTDVDQMCLIGTNLFQPIMLVTLTPDAKRKSREDLGKGLIGTMQIVNQNLEPHEEIAKVVVAKDSWTIDNGMMTPTMKVKRAQVEAHYAPLLEKEGALRTPLGWED